MPPPTVPPPKMPRVTVSEPAESDMEREVDADDDVNERDRPSVEGEGAKAKLSVSPIEKAATAMIVRWNRMVI